MDFNASFSAIFFFSFAAGLGAVMSPGPLSTAIVTQSPRRGWLVGPVLATGHSFLEILLVALIGIGLGTVLALPPVKTAIAVLGGILLVWMGGGMILGVYQKKVRLPEKDSALEPMSYGELFGLGLLTTVSNPFWYAWWVTVAAGYLAQAQAAGIGAVSAFYLGHITADFLWDTILSTVVAGGRRWISSRLYQGIIFVCGLFFLYLGYTFLSHGFSSI